MIEWLAKYKDAAPAVGAIIALASAAVALVVFAYTRKANRSRATLDMVMKTTLDEAGRARYTAFKELMTRHADQLDTTNIVQFANPAVPTTGDKKVLNDQLNEYELIALGIRTKIFDESIYKSWFQGQFMRDMDSLVDYIAEVHKARPSVFCEMSWLNARWQKKPHPKSKPNVLIRIGWTIKGENAKLQQYLNTQPK